MMIVYKRPIYGGGLSYGVIDKPDIWYDGEKKQHYVYAGSCRTPYFKEVRNVDLKKLQKISAEMRKLQKKFDKTMRDAYNDGDYYLREK